MKNVIIYMLSVCVGISFYLCRYQQLQQIVVPLIWLKGYNLTEMDDIRDIDEKNFEIPVPSAMPPSVVVDGMLYLIDGNRPISKEHMEEDYIEMNYIGAVSSVVPPDELPVKDGETNFSYVGALIVRYGEGVALELEDGSWQGFKEYGAVGGQE